MRVHHRKIGESQVDKHGGRFVEERQLHVKGGFDSSSSRISFSAMQEVLFLTSSPLIFGNGESWEDFEDRLAILLYNDEQHLDLFRSLYKSGIHQPPVLASLAYLMNLRTVRDSQLIDYLSSTFVYAASFDAVARFLCNPCTCESKKQNCIRVLLVREGDSSTITSLDISQVLYFVLGEDTKKFSMNNMSEQFHSHLFWELRLKCLKEKSSSWQIKERRRKRIKEGTERVVYRLWTGARSFETNLSSTTDFLNHRILDPVGIWICRNSSPEAGRGRRLQDLKEYHRTKLVTVCSCTAKELSDYAYDKAQSAVNNLRKASVKTVSSIGEKFEAQTDDLVSDEDGRVVLAAVGQVGIAAIAAAAIVGEAMIESTRQVVEKTTMVAADVVEHKYGPVAGGVVREVADTIGNIVRTTAFIAMLKGTSLTEMVAKDSSRARLLKLLENRKM